MKKILPKILPKKVYSFLVRFSKAILILHATSGIKKSLKNSSQKKILIVKTDAIGDYIMSRDFIREIRKSKKYKNHEIHLLGNVVWKNIFSNLDNRVVDKAYFINRKHLYDRQYIKPLIEEINKENFELVIHPVCHREFAIDYVIKKINAKEKIGHSGTSMNQSEFERSITNKFYTKLIKSNQKLEFYRNKSLFAQILKERINLQNPKINIKKKQGNYFVVNPGASLKFKQWSPENFAKVIDYLIEKYKAKVYIVGSAAELKLDHKVKNSSKHKDKIEIKNGGSLFDLLNLIAGSRGVISNETCTPHMAVALGKKVYCITTGVGYLSAYPYPNYKNAIYFYPPNFNISKPTNQILNINKITPAEVIKRIRF
jgi:ADP-heptose:LPS heptosyltransferase